MSDREFGHHQDMCVTIAPQGVCAMLVIVVRKHHHWVGGTVGCFSPLEACMLPSSMMSAILSSSSQAYGSRVCTQCLSNRDLPSTHEGQPRAITVPCNILRLLGNSDQKLKRGPLKSGIRVFVRWSLALGEALSVHIRKLHLNYICIFIHRVNSLQYESIRLFQTSLLLPPSSVCIYLLPRHPFPFP